MLDAVSRKIGNVARDDVFWVIVRPQSTKYLIIKSIVGSYVRAAGAAFRGRINFATIQLFFVHKLAQKCIFYIRKLKFLLTGA